MSKGISIFLHFKSTIMGLGVQDIETEVSAYRYAINNKVNIPTEC